MVHGVTYFLLRADLNGMIFKRLNMDVYTKIFIAAILWASASFIYRRNRSRMLRARTVAPFLLSLLVLEGFVLFVY